MVTTHFITGLPRSGSTLLTNILAQCPRFVTAGTSGLVDILVHVRNQWDRIPEFRAMKPKDSLLHKARVLRGMFDAYFGDGGIRDHKVYFDKSRSWLGHIEMLDFIFGEPASFIVCVRDIREIIASLEMLWRQASATRQLPFEAKDYAAFQSLPGRIGAWMSNDGVLGIAYNRVLDAVRRGFRDRLHFVRYEDLVWKPHWTMGLLHDFIGEPHFLYDFENVEQVTHENDEAYGFPGNLHTIRQKVEPQEIRWPEVLGLEAGKALEPMNALLLSQLRETDMNNADSSSSVAGNPSPPVSADCQTAQVCAVP